MKTAAGMRPFFANKKTKERMNAMGFLTGKTVIITGGGRACVAMCSPDFKYMSGETITLEGGMGLRP